MMKGIKSKPPKEEEKKQTSSAPKTSEIPKKGVKFEPTAAKAVKFNTGDNQEDDMDSIDSDGM